MRDSTFGIGILPPLSERLTLRVTCQPAKGFSEGLQGIFPTRIFPSATFSRRQPITYVEVGSHHSQWPAGLEAPHVVGRCNFLLSKSSRGWPPRLPWHPCTTHPNQGEGTCARSPAQGSTESHRS